MAHSDKKHLTLKILLAATILFIIALTALLVQQYKRIERLSYLHDHRQSIFRSLHGSGPLGAADASSTESWMTFDYIDRAFLLPPTYLETSLGISDGRFPRMTISEYAEDKGIPSGLAVSEVEDAIRFYLSDK